VIHHGKTVTTAFRVKRGKGLDGQEDGFCVQNLLATYTHVHAGGMPAWGNRLFEAALDRKHGKNKKF
jgi:cobyrinic acid a,c-diamide synthase